MTAEKNKKSSSNKKHQGEVDVEKNEPHQQTRIEENGARIYRINI